MRAKEEQARKEEEAKSYTREVVAAAVKDLRANTFDLSTASWRLKPFDLPKTKAAYNQLVPDNLKAKPRPTTKGDIQTALASYLRKAATKAIRVEEAAAAAVDATAAASAAASAAVAASAAATAAVAAAAAAAAAVDGAEDIEVD